jgi:hypothetical protein
VTLTKRWLVALGAGLALTTASAPLAGASTTAPASSTAQATSTATLSAGNAAAARVGIDPSPVHEALKRAINPGDYQCGPTRFDSYIDGLFDGLTQQEFTFLVGHVAMLDIPTYDALLFGSATDARYALRSDYKVELTRTFRDLKRFWDIESSDIQLMSMHGSMLQDPVRVARVLQLPIPGFGFTPAAAQQAANEISAFTRSGGFSGGDNPLFTLNAFAFTAEGDPDPLVQGVPDKMIFGDGIVDALNALGIGDVGPRVVLAHEFGHHIQFENGLFDSTLTGPEATRRTELMADAFGTYFAVHAKGLSLNRKRVMHAEQTFFEVGDCSFTNDGHHGTPLQRLRAATWGASVADAARPQSYILPSATFAAMFDQKLPELVAPDAA